MEQRTPEWVSARLGKLTASSLNDMLATTKSGYSASRKNLLSRLVVERMTGQPVDNFTNDAMQWGIDKEPEARAAYEIVTGNLVKPVGFIDHPKIAMSGASPDGLVDENGQLEIKCPTTATHIETLIGQSIPTKHEPQIQWQLACTGRAWCDFASFDPRMPPHLRLFVRRMERDNVRIAQLENAVMEFLFEVDKTIAALNALKGSR